MMSSQMAKCPTTGLILPRKFIDEKTSLKKSIDELVDRAVRDNQRKHGSYFLTIHAKFNSVNPEEFTMDYPKITDELPPFISNSFVFWVNNQRSICELLWMVAPKHKGQKLKVEFNKEGVAYLQAKGGMPS